MTRKRRGNGEGSIYRRKDGRWAAALTLDNGKRQTLYSWSRREVADKLATAIRNRKLGSYAGTNPTLRQFLTHWLEEVARPRIRQGTYASYKTACNQYADDALGRVRLRELRDYQIQQCESRMLESISVRTLRTRHRVLLCALNEAIREGFIAYNPARSSNVPKVPRRDMAILSASQLQTLFEMTPETRWRTLWMLLASTGLRIGEALALKWEDVDLDAWRISVSKTLVYQPGHSLSRQDVKSEASRRVVTFPALMAQQFRSHRHEQNQERVAHRLLWQEYGLVFTSQFGSALYATNCERMFKRHLERAGLPPCRPHDLRHSAATILLQQGFQPKVVQEMLGHASYAITMDVYSHVVPGMHEKASAVLGDLLTRKERGA